MASNASNLVFISNVIYGIKYMYLKKNSVKIFFIEPKTATNPYLSFTTLQHWCELAMTHVLTYVYCQVPVEPLIWYHLVGNLFMFFFLKSRLLSLQINIQWQYCIQKHKHVYLNICVKSTLYLKQTVWNNIKNFFINHRQGHVLIPNQEQFRKIRFELTCIQHVHVYCAPWFV